MELIVKWFAGSRSGNHRWLFARHVAAYVYERQGQGGGQGREEDRRTTDTNSGAQQWLNHQSTNLNFVINTFFPFCCIENEKL